MTVSSVTLAMVKEFCGIYDNDSDDLLSALMPAAKSYIMGYTGLTAAEIDEHEDIVYAYCVIINDAFNNRDYTLSSYRKPAPTVENILSMYAVNHLG